MVTRIAGATRYDTAVALSQYGYPNGSDLVVIATGTNFPDALTIATAIPAAPLLLLPATGIPANVAAEIQRLGATRAVIVGGEGAVTAEQAAQIDSLLTTGSAGLGVAPLGTSPLGA